MRAAIVIGLLVGCEEAEGPKSTAVDPPTPDMSWVWADQDGDGYAGWQDCDDASPRVYPGATERCNGTDEACDGLDDEADLDGDTWRLCEGDCDDGDATINPGADETWYDGIDQDCDGRDDDRDGDGSPVAEDCDDLDARRYPGAVEHCDGRDNDCDGVAPDETDDDGDGQRICEGDCDDTTVWTFLGSDVELCGDERDNDCDGTAEKGCTSCDVLVPGDFDTIQAALDGADDEVVVCVAAGTWQENLDFGGASLTLWGIHGAARTILDGGGSTIGLPVVQFVSAESPKAVLRGFTVTNGETREYGGSGIRIVGSSPTLVDLLVTANGSGLDYADIGGVGVWIEGGAPALVDTQVTENVSRGRWGEAALGGGLHLLNADVALENVLIEGNDSDSAGCGIFMETSSATLSQVSLVSNGGSCNAGAGVYLDASSIEMSNTLLAGNWATYFAHGGGLSLWESTARLTNVIVSGNGAGHEGFGGGFYAVSSELDLTNVSIEDNAAVGWDYASYGGGIHAWNTTLTLTNCSVTNNWAEWGDKYTKSGSGGAMYLRGGTTTVRHSDFWGNSPENIVGDYDYTLTTDSTLRVDPAYEDDALHLSATSPLIDAGDPTILDPDGSRSDIGAWGGPFAAEWDLDGDGWSAWWLPGAYDAATSPDMDCDDDDASVYPGSGC